MAIEIPWHYWNWWAFIFCWAWYCYRGMIARGLFLTLIYFIGIGIISTVSDAVIGLIFVGLFHFYCGLFGQRDYLNHLQYKKAKGSREINAFIKKKGKY